MQITPAVLGWSNPTTGPESLRLYATDKGKSPRWDGEHGRVVEQALREQGGTGEGDRYLVVRVGDRFTSDADMTAVMTAVMDVLRRNGVLR